MWFSFWLFYCYTCDDDGDWMIFLFVFFCNVCRRSLYHKQIESCSKPKTGEQEVMCKGKNKRSSFSSKNSLLWLVAQPVWGRFRHVMTRMVQYTSFLFSWKICTWTISSIALRLWLLLEFIKLWREGFSLVRSFGIVNYWGFHVCFVDLDTHIFAEHELRDTVKITEEG